MKSLKTLIVTLALGMTFAPATYAGGTYISPKAEEKKCAEKSSNVYALFGTGEVWDCQIDETAPKIVLRNPEDYFGVRCRFGRSKMISRLIVAKAEIYRASAGLTKKVASDEIIKHLKKIYQTQCDHLDTESVDRKLQTFPGYAQEQQESSDESGTKIAQ